MPLKKQYRHLIIKDIPEFLIIENINEEEILTTCDTKHKESDKPNSTVEEQKSSSDESDYFYELQQDIPAKIQNQTDKTSLICEICGKIYKNKKSMRTHMLTHTRNIIKPCEICGKLLTAVNYSRHVNSHSGLHKHECNFCNKTFNQLSNLKSHLTIHTNEKPFKCKVCDEKFRNHGALCAHNKSHSDLKHNNYEPKKTSCHICGKMFTENNLRKHLIVHTDERPFKCTICDKSYKYAETLASHNLFHEDSKPYQCKSCDKNFRTSSTLSKHTKIHLGTRNHKCSFCNKYFTTSTHLQTHSRIHTGEMRFKCDLCNKEFRHSGTLKNHKKTHK